MNPSQVENVTEIKKELDLINFNKVLLEDSKGIGHSYNPGNKPNQHSYTPDAFRPPFSCTICEVRKCNLPNDTNYTNSHSLKNVSHVPILLIICKHAAKTLKILIFLIGVTSLLSFFSKIQVMTKAFIQIFLPTKSGLQNAGIGFRMAVTTLILRGEKNIKIILAAKVIMGWFIH